jgi:cell division protein FtsL
MAKKTNTSQSGQKSRRKANALTQILNGEFLTKSFVLNNLPFIFFTLLLLILFVSKGYYVKQINDDIKNTELEVNQNAAEFLEVKSSFEFKTRRQDLIEKLKERDLKESLNATKVIRIKPSHDDR